MSQKWRWDQGRLTYFQFENLKTIASCLATLEGVVINQKDIDPLRISLTFETDLPFAPQNYRVWRNYKRVFECSYLATNINDRLYISDFCKRLDPQKENSIDADEYFSLFIPRFRFPFVAFNDYHQTDSIVYPCCAILKYLISKFLLENVASISIEDVFAIVIGNNCTGLETIEFYSSLKRTSYVAVGDEYRQVRELLIFISQISILKWNKGILFLDITLKDFEDYNGFKHLIEPEFRTLKRSREEEFISITSIDNLSPQIILPSRETYTDDIFLEGKKSRVNHIKIERSPLLRKLYFNRYPHQICDMCTCDTRERYPWTENILEVHHILPLSSALLVTGEGTSLNDVVGLCPNCHKSVHSFYKRWLNDSNFSDFRNKDEAKEIYLKAKTSIIL